MPRGRTDRENHRAITANLLWPFLALLAAGCDQQAANRAGSVPPSCLTTVGTQQLFIGEPRCLAGLPAQALSGYWVSGHEYSALYSNLDDARATAESRALWLFEDSKARATASALIDEGEWQIFSVTLRGRQSTAAGTYGPGGFKGAVLAEDFLAIEEVK